MTHPLVLDKAPSMYMTKIWMDYEK